MLNDFIIKENVGIGLEKLLQSNDIFDQFFNEAFKQGDLILVGGAIRDFALHRNPKDLDIIIDCNLYKLNDLMNKYNFHKNRFGGYKFKIKDIQIDIWNISNHWAFKENIYECSFENISKGAFFNFDAITLSLKDF